MNNKIKERGTISAVVILSLILTAIPQSLYAQRSGDSLSTDDNFKLIVSCPGSLILQFKFSGAYCSFNCDAARSGLAGRMLEKADELSKNIECAKDSLGEGCLKVYSLHSYDGRKCFCYWDYLEGEMCYECTNTTVKVKIECLKDIRGGNALSEVPKKCGSCTKRRKFNGVQEQATILNGNIRISSVSENSIIKFETTLSKSDNYVVEIIDVLGRKIREFNITPSQGESNFKYNANLTNGVYFVRVKDDRNRTLWVGKTTIVK